MYRADDEGRVGAMVPHGRATEVDVKATVLVATTNKTRRIVAGVWRTIMMHGMLMC